MSYDKNTYTFNDAAYGTHALIAKEIGTNQDILDVGCNKGYLKLLAQENTYYGIDFSKEDLEQAKEFGYKEVFQLNLNRYENFSLQKEFDVIVLADVLEHLLHPDQVLRFFIQRSLKDEGIVIISLPNVANISVRIKLLFGMFDYTENGILDKTHLHLYTKKSAEKFLQESGLRIVKRKFSSNRFGRLIEWFPWLGGLLGFNLIFVCQKRYS